MPRDYDREKALKNAYAKMRAHDFLVPHLELAAVSLIRLALDVEQNWPVSQIEGAIDEIIKADGKFRRIHEETQKLVGTHKEMARRLEEAVLLLANWFETLVDLSVKTDPHDTGSPGDAMHGPFAKVAMDTAKHLWQDDKDATRILSRLEDLTQRVRESGVDIFYLARAQRPHVKYYNKIRLPDEARKPIKLACTMLDNLPGGAITA